MNVTNVQLRYDYVTPRYDRSLINSLIFYSIFYDGKKPVSLPLEVK
jgi:hypothetical protein